MVDLFDVCFDGICFILVVWLVMLVGCLIILYGCVWFVWYDDLLIVLLCDIW